MELFIEALEDAKRAYEEEKGRSYGPTDADGRHRAPAARRLPDPFGMLVMNKGGDYALREVTIEGTE